MFYLRRVFTNRNLRHSGTNVINNPYIGFIKGLFIGLWYMYGTICDIKKSDTKLFFVLLHTNNNYWQIL